ncbi:hypothetical protein CLAFUW4_11576 [Fulvia fulva]|uniref:Uncharacterized protein n=1 Tax=Passalora fulva TaxID=5499 RepID=A0A9Q8PBT6_PASFU|nr:uncharacterized protein CLAFUR5_10619 [Fulvia fulva]KAK4620397.1 hypothetical protein CLAFUR0_11590 [Fulvia fulva]UJO19545.1 hypothetical protein CLAFUR5_10619 [Fulvia fulva]WPV17332.1 hypothetical protein CLAFUW4_11576 [Fulvia fulva]WPV32530.1 hypothetical protein CLAFUW7_11580 [Fulvia fulva]
MSSYFNLSSFARAKKNQDQLQKTNPKEPVLKDEDEKFLERHMSQDQATEVAKDLPATTITDQGEERPASSSEQKVATEGDHVVPAAQPESPTSSEKKAKKNKDFELPSQEEAEAATRGWNDQVKLDDTRPASSGDKKIWASYIPQSLKPAAKKDGANEPAPEEKQKDDSLEGSTEDLSASRTWKDYAASYVPTTYPTLPSLPASWTRKDKDSQPEPVYKEDGTIDGEKTKEKQEKEVSVLLDNLNMSAINNRVFALSDETAKIYERFQQVLKDTINGAPTAYDDMEKLMKEAGPTLEKQFASMPPFVQTLVKSLPAKLGGTLAPEILAAASEKPGSDLKARMETASAGETDTEPGSSKSGEKAAEKKKKKRTIPGMKSLLSKEGAAAGMLRNTVNFLRVRFPFLASTTNVVMSLAVFILMFVFWYCHKRGKEVRLAKAAENEQRETKKGEVEEVDDDGEDIEEDDTDEDEVDQKIAQDIEARLNQPAPKDVPLPTETKDEKTG